jgi:hypothetical protein
LGKIIQVKWFLLICNMVEITMCQTSNPVLLPACADDKVEWRAGTVWCNSHCANVSDGLDFLLHLYMICIFLGTSGSLSLSLSLSLSISIYLSINKHTHTHEHTSRWHVWINPVCPLMLPLRVDLTEFGNH